MTNPKKPILEIAKIYAQIHPELDANELYNTYMQVAQLWEKEANKFSKRVTFLIIGEATQNLENYFYNMFAKITPFLTPSHFNCSSKSELIIKLKELNALIFDLYPLPLATAYYDKLKVNHPDYEKYMTEYFKEALDGKVDENTIIVVRYSKLLKRKEWGYFNKFWNNSIKKNSEIKIYYETIAGSFYAKSSAVDAVFKINGSELNK